MADNRFEGGLAGIDLRQEFESIGGRISGEIELRIDKVQAVMDAKLNGVEREINAKLDGKPGHGALVGHTVAIIGLLGALILSVMALGGDRFDGGMSASGAFATQLEAQAARDRQQDEKLDRILANLESRYDQPKESDRAK